MVFKGFQYGKDKQMDTKIYWKCDDRACKGRVVTSSGEPVIILKETPHNLHGPSVAQIEVKKSLARMKEAARCTFFGKLLSFSHYLIFRPNFDEFSTKFRQMSIRRDVFRRKFDEWSRST